MLRSSRRRLWLGLLLACWAIITCTPAKPWPLVVFASPDSPRVQQTVAGLKAVLGDLPLKVVCAPEFGREGDDLLRGLRREKPAVFIVLGTPALLRLAAVEKKIPTVFAMVANPYFSGAAYDPRHPDWHQFNITGIASPPPVKEALEQGSQLMGRHPWGMLSEPLDATAVEVTAEFLRAAASLGLTAMVERTDGGADDRVALGKLLARGAKIIYLPPTVSAGRYAPLLLSWGRAGKVLVVNGHPEISSAGAILSVTLDYFRLGEETARLAQRVLAGDPPRKLPIETLTPVKITADDSLLRRWSAYPPPATP